ncbi:MAG TPA: ABC transporter permease [Burkholderiaceae bacterium]|nr:ABC transporter permease [Burkholderiaceae bacterium]
MSPVTTTLSPAGSLQPRRRKPWPNAAIAAVSLVLIATLWTVVSTSGWLPQGYLPSPQELFAELMTLATVGYKGTSLWMHIGISLFRTLTGFMLGIALGIPLGLLTGYNRVAGAAVSPVMAFIRPIPPIAFIPMVVLYFGLGETGKVVLIFWTAFNYVHVNAHAGAAGVPISYLRAAKSIGLTDRQTFFRVVLPAAIPQIFTGLKVGMALAWAVVVAAELTGAQSGLGYMIADAALTFRIAAVFIGIALIGLIGLALNIALNFLEARVVHWRGRT